MIDKEIIEHFMRAKVLLQERLSEVGKIPGSAEIESQLTFTETRIISEMKQAMYHGTEQINALRFILNEIAKPDAEEDGT